MIVLNGTLPYFNPFQSDLLVLGCGKGGMHQIICWRILRWSPRLLQTASLTASNPQLEDRAENARNHFLLAP